MTVTVYSTTTCPYCKLLKAHLDEKNIKYQEKLVDQDEAAQKQMLEKSGGFQGVPFTVVVKDDGSEETIIGFDKNKINQNLGISE